MTVKTRYRDIPWEEAVQCSPNLTRERWDKVYRGQTVNVTGGPEPPEEFKKFTNCQGPWWRTNRMNTDGHVAAICPHIAEIGD